MATKTIAVTLASIQNTGTINVSPRGLIQCRTVRAVDDEQVFQGETLYNRPLGQPVPMHPSGATFVPPGESLSFNVTGHLTVSQFGDDESEGLNEMLLIFSELTQRFVVSGDESNKPYFGDDRKKVRFDDIEGFNIVTCLHNAFTGGDETRFTATYTVNLLKVSG